MSAKLEKNPSASKPPASRDPSLYGRWPLCRDRLPRSNKQTQASRISWWIFLDFSVNTFVFLGDFFLLSVIFIGFLGDIFLIFRWFFFISWISRCFFWISRRGPGSRLGVLVQWSRVGFLVGLGVRNKSRLLVFYKYINNICFREGVKKTFFLGDLSQMWVVRVADSRTRPNPLKTPPNHRENHLFRPEFHLSFSQISQKPWGGWVGKQCFQNTFGKDLPKKRLFFWRLPGKRLVGSVRSHRSHRSIYLGFLVTGSVYKVIQDTIYRN